MEQWDAFSQRAGFLLRSDIHGAYDRYEFLFYRFDIDVSLTSPSLMSRTLLAWCCMPSCASIHVFSLRMAFGDPYFPIEYRDVE